MTGRWSPVHLMVFILLFKNAEQFKTLLTASETLLRALQAEIAEIQATDTAPLVHPSILFSKRQTRNNHFSKLSVKTSLP